MLSGKERAGFFLTIAVLIVVVLLFIALFSDDGETGGSYGEAPASGEGNAAVSTSSGVQVIDSEQDMGAAFSIDIDQFIDEYNRLLTEHVKVNGLSEDGLTFLQLSRADATCVQDVTSAGNAYTSYTWVKSTVLLGINTDSKGCVYLIDMTYPDNQEAFSVMRCLAGCFLGVVGNTDVAAGDAVFANSIYALGADATRVPVWKENIIAKLSSSFMILAASDEVLATMKVYPISEQAATTVATETTTTTTVPTTTTTQAPATTTPELAGVEYFYTDDYATDVDDQSVLEAIADQMTRDEIPIEEGFRLWIKAYWAPGDVFGISADGLAAVYVEEDGCYRLLEASDEWEDWLVYDVHNIGEDVPLYIVKAGR